MDFTNGEVVKLKNCGYIDREYWGKHALIEKITDSNKFAWVRCHGIDCLAHTPSFKCKIECLEKIVP